jgi:hypothetical protein
MKINISKKEYEKLIELIDIAMWVITSHDLRDKPENAPYNELEEKIFSLAKEFSCEDKIVYDKELNRHFQTQEFELESAHRKFVDDYDENILWEELIERLAQRDSVNEVGEGNYFSMEFLERMSIFGKHEEYWTNEFGNFGLGRLMVQSLSS